MRAATRWAAPDSARRPACSAISPGAPHHRAHRRRRRVLRARRHRATLLELLSWAAGADVAVAVVGSGSNLLVADEGVDGLVLKLDRELAGIEREGPRILCGGGARLPAVAARAARAGLSGIEFGVNIPGTVGGAVRMNANAYGGELGAGARVGGDRDGRADRAPEPADLGLGYRRSNLAAGEIVLRAGMLLSRGDPQTVRATLAEMRARRHEAQPQGIKTFGSTFKNPEDPRAEGRSAGLLLAEAGCNGLVLGGARFAPSTPTSSRTPARPARPTCSP